MSTSTPPNCTTGLETSWLTSPLVWPRARPVTIGVSVMWPRFRHVSPSCHLGGIEARGGGPHCWGMSMLAAALVVTIRVYDLYGLSPDDAPGGPGARGRGAGPRRRPGDHRRLQRRAGMATPCKTGLADGEIMLRIHRHPKDGAHVLGDAIVRGDAGPEHDRHRLRRGHRRAVTAHRHAPRDDRRPRLGARDRAPAARHERPRVARPDAPSWELQRLDRGDWDFTIEDAATIRRRLQPRERRPRAGGARRSL